MALPLVRSGWRRPGPVLLLAAHPGLSGIYAVSDPLEAFATRAQLARAAGRARSA